MKKHPTLLLALLVFSTVAVAHGRGVWFERIEGSRINQI